MKAVIVGGSLVGLMHGIMLKHNGYDVEILEQTADRLEGQAAGVATGLFVHHFLVRHDRLKGDFAFPCHGVRVRDPSNKLVSEMKTRMSMTSWDALYFRLRANFDNYKSDFYPNPPPQEKGDGNAVYHSGKKLVHIHQNDGCPDRDIIVQYKDVLTGEVQTMDADLVVGADGANSSVRSLLCPKATGRRYAGYVMWRGLVPERDVSPETAKQFNEWFSFCPVPQLQDYVVIYPIPGKNGSLKAGEREINFAWYAQITPVELSEALTDVEGHKHKWSVPNGKLKQGIWEKQLQRAGDKFNAPCKELATKIKRPFLQVVGDFTAPQASFLGGKVLLVGDGLVTLRPHTGTGISSGAFQALQLERALFDQDKEGKKNLEVAIKEWESKVFEYSHMERLRSISWGEYYLGGWMGWLPAALHYHGLLKLKSWWAWAGGFFPKL